MKEERLNLEKRMFTSLKTSRWTSKETLRLFGARDYPFIAIVCVRGVGNLLTTCDSLARKKQDLIL